MKQKTTKRRFAAIKELLFFKSFSLAKSNLDKAGLMILFDALFLVSVFALHRLSKYLAQSIVANQTLASFFIFIIFSLIYYLLILFVYSFFKYCVLDSIKSLFVKTEFLFRRLWQFYSLNIIIAGIFFAIMFFLNVVLASIKQTYQPFVFVFLAIPYLLLLYIAVNTSHSLFYEGCSIKESIKKGFETAFVKIKVYKETILIMVLAGLLLWVLFLGSGYLIRLIAYKNYGLYLNVYAYFKQASILVFDLVLYLVILINRVSFYAMAREGK